MMSSAADTGVCRRVYRRGVSVASAALVRKARVLARLVHPWRRRAEGIHLSPDMHSWADIGDVVPDWLAFVAERETDNLRWPS